MRNLFGESELGQCLDTIGYDPAKSSDAPKFAKRDSELADAQDRPAIDSAVPTEAVPDAAASRGVALDFSDALIDQRRALASIVRRRLDRYGLKDVGVRFADRVKSFRTEIENI
jgi:hypothetical protein